MHLPTLLAPFTPFTYLPTCLLTYLIMCLLVYLNTYPCTYSLDLFNWVELFTLFHFVITNLLTRLLIFVFYLYVSLTSMHIYLCTYSLLRISYLLSLLSLLTGFHSYYSYLLHLNYLLYSLYFLYLFNYFTYSLDLCDWVDLITFLSFVPTYLTCLPTFLLTYFALFF